MRWWDVSFLLGVRMRCLTSFLSITVAHFQSSHLRLGHNQLFYSESLFWIFLSLQFSLKHRASFKQLFSIWSALFFSSLALASPHQEQKWHFSSLSLSWTSQKCPCICSPPYSIHVRISLLLFFFPLTPALLPSSLLFLISFFLEGNELLNYPTGFSCPESSSCWCTQPLYRWTGLKSSDKDGSSEFVYLPNLVLTFHKCEIQGGNLMLPKMLLLSLKLPPNKKKSLSNFKEFSRHT